MIKIEDINFKSDCCAMDHSEVNLTNGYELEVMKNSNLYTLLIKKEGILVEEVMRNINEDDLISKINDLAKA